MCMRLRSTVSGLICLFSVIAFSAETGSLTQKLPPQTLQKHAMAYFSFDKPGTLLNRNLIQSPLTIQTRGTRYTPEGLNQGALEYNGTSGQVMISISVTNTLTLSAWYLSRTDSFSACTLQSNQAALTIRLHSQGTLEINQTTPSSQGTSSFNKGLGLPVNQWHHLALVITPLQYALYVNGQCLGNINMPMNLSQSKLLIADPAFRGKVDELALFGEALSAEDIEALYKMHRPSLNSGAVPFLQNNTWEAKAANTYAMLTQAINSGNWSAAATQATILSDLVTTYLKDQKTDLTDSAQTSIQNNLTKASTLITSFKTAVEQAQYRSASDLFDTLDEVWEILEIQLNLLPSSTNSANATLDNSMQTQSTQFSQTWSSSGAMPGSSFSGSISGGSRGTPGAMSGGSFSMSSSVGPNGQMQFNSIGSPGLALMNQSMNQMPPQMMQQLVMVQNQRIQMTLNTLKMSLLNADWQMAQVHSNHLQRLFTQMDASEALLSQPNTRMRRRLLDLNALPPDQQPDMKAQVQKANHHLSLLSNAMAKQDVQAANEQLQSLEKINETINQMLNKPIQSMIQPSKP